MTIRRFCVCSFANLPDFALMAAVTFEDVIGSCAMSLLFRELVHAEQYRQLGTDRFVELYLRGFLTSGSYEATPLKVQA